MTTLDRLNQWRESGAITGAQYDQIRTLVRKDRFSVFLELNVLLYLGVLALAGGIATTVQKYFASLTDVAVLISLTILFIGTLYYCFKRGAPFSSGLVESPALTLDYVLYFSCLVLATELAYIEYRFAFLKDREDFYFLITAVVFFALAYRFDNRLVLSLALSSLAAAFGLRLARFHMESDNSLRIAGIGYSLLVSTIGLWLSRVELKKHFLQSYLHIACNVLLISLLSGILDLTWWPRYLAGLLVAAVSAIYFGVRFNRLAFVAYGVVYGYIGFSIRVLEGSRDIVGSLLFIVITGSAVIIGLVVLARRIGRHE